ncbi:agmatinase [Candidatus Omnitrophota bacterium]
MAVCFGGTDNKFTSFKKAKVVVLPVPYGKTATYRKGTENGPNAILNASDKMELFDEELNKEIHVIGINTAASLEVEGLKSEEMISVVEKKVSDVFAQNKFPVMLGGEHSITIGAIGAAKKQHKNLSILYFDAHGDLRDSYAGSKYNHACVARRLIEMADVVEAGVRSLSKEEKEILPGKNIKIISMLDMLSSPDWFNTVRDSLSDNIYISVDLDVFDPSIMPSVGAPEPGGMLWYEFLKAIRNIITDKTVVGFDVVELCPIKDIVTPDFTAARLIYKMLGYIFAK